MSETMCKQKLESVLKSNSKIKSILVTGKRNEEGVFVKNSMAIIIDSNDTIRGLALVKLQELIKTSLGFDVKVYEKCELELDSNLKTKLINFGKPLIINAM